ncbi:hypothetical protein M422DRAFT_246830 [Sphaerobolus stellatus SS14]|nr:hypothetical protein M422DRAFT_246830 [Sphaerobolus stellatus SS14]
MSDSKESQSKRSRNAAELLSRFREKQAQRDGNHVEHPARFSFSRDEILDGIHEAWPHITKYIRDLDVSHSTLEKELDIEKTDNRRLRSQIDDLDETIQELEARILSLQQKTLRATNHYRSPLQPTSQHQMSLFENPSFQNRVRVLEQQPDYWSLYMWNALKEWHTNPMSVPNALRDDHDSYFLEEDLKRT